MALTEKLGNIADAIRAKTGKTEKLSLDQMPQEIAGIIDAADPILQEKTITENGEYTADSGYDGLSKVTVDVPIPDGYVQPTGTLEITESGTYDVSGYASAEVNVPGEVVEEYDGIISVTGEAVEEYDGTITIE